MAAVSIKRSIKKQNNNNNKKNHITKISQAFKFVWLRAVKNCAQKFTNIFIAKLQDGLQHFSICIGNSMICSDIWHKRPQVIFENCFTSFHEPLSEWILRQFWNIASGNNAKYHVQIMLLFVLYSAESLQPTKGL